MTGLRTPSQADLLSLSRPLLGVMVYIELSRGGPSLLVLPAVALACWTDWLDGTLARRSGAPSSHGRLLDNLCDGLFLALVLTAFAQRQLWSPPVWGSAIRYWEHANWAPVLGLGASFGLYLLRWAASSIVGFAMQPSRRGHEAGIANYVLAVVGAVAVTDGLELSRWLLEPAFATVVLYNLLGAADNLILLFHGILWAPRMKR